MLTGGSVHSDHFRRSTVIGCLQTKELRRRSGSEAACKRDGVASSYRKVGVSKSAFCAFLVFSPIVASE